MNIKITFLTFFIFLCGTIYGQGNDNPFTRAQAIVNRGIVFFNVDGIEITAQKKDADFSTKNCVSEFPQLKIKKKELTTDSLLGFRNFYVYKSHENPANFFHITSYYFVETPDNYLIAFTFSSINKNDKEFERKFITLACNNRIPQNIYHSNVLNTINFAGRKIPLENSNCKWLGVNNVECSNCGQMNWSIHKDFDDASATVNNHFISSIYRKGAEIISDAFIEVIFEGVETTARKVVYSITGKSSFSLNMFGGNSLALYYTPAPRNILTVYFIAAPVRGNFVSCVMSFWESDQINSSGLPPLLEQVMELRK